MKKEVKSMDQMTDEEIIKEFVRRFDCDGAILIYFDSSVEYGFGRWKNVVGKNWVNRFFKHLAPNELNIKRRVMKKALLSE